MIILITLVVYSIITLIILHLTNYNDKVIYLCALGIVGCTLLLISKVYYYIEDHYTKRSIFLDWDGNKVTCKVKDYLYVYLNSGYTPVKERAGKEEYKYLKSISKEYIKICRERGLD